MAAALTLVLAPGPAALADDGRFSLTALAGVPSELRFGRLVPLSNTADVPEIKVLLEHRPPAFGLGLGYRLTRRLEAEGAVFCGRARVVNDVGIGFGGFPLGKSTVSDAVLLAWSGDLVYHFRVRGLSPYAGAGAGAAALDTEKVGSKTRFACHLRAGVRAPLADGLDLIMDLRDLIAFFQFPEDLRIAYPLIYTPDTAKPQHSVGIFLGLRYHF